MKIEVCIERDKPNKAILYANMPKVDVNAIAEWDFHLNRFSDETLKELKSKIEERLNHGGI